MSRGLGDVYKRQAMTCTRNFISLLLKQHWELLKKFRQWVEK
nr:hypothetical protein [Elizabethkingia sp. ASV34]